MQVVLAVRYLPPYAGDIRDVSSIPELGRSHGKGHGNPLQYSCLENPMDRRAWGVAKSQTRLKRFSMNADNVEDIHAPCAINRMRTQYCFRKQVGAHYTICWQEQLLNCKPTQIIEWEIFGCYLGDPVAPRSWLYCLCLVMLK